MQTLLADDCHQPPAITSTSDLSDISHAAQPLNNSTY